MKQTIIITILALIFLAGCQVGDVYFPDTVPNINDNPEAFICSTDADCVSQQTSCNGCNCPRAINKDYQKQLLCKTTKNMARCDLWCEPSKPVCVNNVCEMEIREVPPWKDDGIVLMQNLNEGNYGCFGCNSELCVDPTQEMTQVEETENMYCNENFEIVGTSCEEIDNQQDCEKRTDCRSITGPSECSGNICTDDEDWKSCVRKTKRQICTEKGGTFYEWYNEALNVCIMPYTDAGKSCTSSEQCEGDCVTNIISNMGKEGTCQETTSRENCYNKIENEYFDCLIGDIMYRCDESNYNDYCDELKGDLFFE